MTSNSRQAFTIIAHRGDSAHAPENTCGAFLQAKKSGARTIEFDVRLTRDLVPVILHDRTLERTTNGIGLLHEKMYEEIKHLDAGSWFACEWSAEKIPALDETISLLKQLNLHAYVELCPHKSNVLETSEVVLKALNQLWTWEPLPVISSFNIQCLEYALRHSPQYPRGLLLDKWADNWLQLATKVRCSGLHLNHKLLTPTRISKIKNAGYLLYAYTVNNLQQAKKLYEWGVDGIYSDDPNILNGI